MWPISGSFSINIILNDLLSSVMGGLQKVTVHLTVCVCCILRTFPGQPEKGQPHTENRENFCILAKQRKYYKDVLEFHSVQKILSGGSAQTHMDTDTQFTYSFDFPVSEEKAWWASNCLATFCQM